MQRWRERGSVCRSNRELKWDRERIKLSNDFYTSSACYPVKEYMAGHQDREGKKGKA